MADIKVNTKDKVKAGQVIGTQGHSGNSAASHLHLEIRKEPPAWGKSSSDLVNPNHIIDLRSALILIYAMASVRLIYQKAALGTSH